MTVPVANDPPFATWNHAAADNRLLTEDWHEALATNGRTGTFQHGIDSMQLVGICGLIIVCNQPFFCRRVGFVGDHLRATEASVSAFLTEPATG